jgi:hypothetical protein
VKEGEQPVPPGRSQERAQLGNRPDGPGLRRLSSRTLGTLDRISLYEPLNRGGIMECLS